MSEVAITHELVVLEKNAMLSLFTTSSVSVATFVTLIEYPLEQ